MFGENGIYGQSTVKKDVKNRVFIPAYTGVEEHDKVVVMKSSHEDGSIEIYSLDTFRSLTENLDEKLKNAITLEEVNTIKRYIESFYSNVYQVSKCDKQHRITLPKDIELDSNLETLGCGSYLLIRKKRG